MTLSETLQLQRVAVATDAVNVVTGNEVDSTKKLIESAGKDLENASNEMMP